MAHAEKPFYAKRTQFQNPLKIINPVTKRTYNKLNQNQSKKTNPIRTQYEPNFQRWGNYLGGTFLRFLQKGVCHSHKGAESSRTEWPLVHAKKSDRTHNILKRSVNRAAPAKKDLANTDNIATIGRLDGSITANILLTSGVPVVECLGNSPTTGRKLQHSR